MPWVRKGTTIYKKTSSGLKKKQKASSVGNAKKAMRFLLAIEHGWRPSKPEKKGWET